MLIFAENNTTLSFLMSYFSSKNKSDICIKSDIYSFDMLEQMKISYLSEFEFTEILRRR